MIFIKYFGKLTDDSKLTEETIPYDDTLADLQDFKRSLETKYPGLKRHAYQIAVNQSIIKSGEIKDGDEVALLPPFSGG